MHEFKTALIALAVCAAFNLGTQALAAATQPRPGDGGEAAKAPDHGTLVIRPQGDEKQDAAALGAKGNAAPGGMNAQAHSDRAFRPDGPDQDQYGQRGAQPPMEAGRNTDDRCPMDGYAQNQRMGSDPRMGPPPERGMHNAYREGPRGMTGDGRFGHDPSMGSPRERGYAQDWDAPRRGMTDGRMTGRPGPDPRMGPPPGRGYGIGPDPRMGPPSQGMGFEGGRAMDPDPRMGPPPMHRHGMDWRNENCPRQDRPVPRGRMPMQDGGPDGNYGVRMLPPAPQGRP